MNNFVVKWAAAVILSTLSFITEGKENLMATSVGLHLQSSSPKLRTHPPLTNISKRS